MIWLYYNKYKGYIQIYYMISKYLFYHIIRIQRGCDHPRKLDDFRVDTPEASTASAQIFCQVQCPRFEANSPAVDAKTQPMFFLAHCASVTRWLRGRAIPSHVMATYCWQMAIIHHNKQQQDTTYVKYKHE